MPADLSPNHEKSATHGFVDGFEGISLRGWAVSAGSETRIVVRDENGRTVARGVSDQERPDVGRLGIGDIRCGFLIPVRRLRRRARLSVYANGDELSGSPVLFGAGIYDGSFAISDGVASGWVSERSERFSGALVELRDQDGNLLGATEAVLDSEADPLRSKAAFSVPLAYPAFGREDLIVRAYVGESCFAEALSALRLDGYLDQLTPTLASGWLACPDAPELSLEIEIFRDGVRVGTARCQHARDDVRHRYPRNWRVGFYAALDPLPHASPESPPPVYSFRLAGTEVELFNGPFVIEDRDWAVAAARRIGQWGRQDGGLGEIERAVLQGAITSFLAQRRVSADRPRRVLSPPRAGLDRRRLNIVIPVYRDVEVTRACIESVLAARDRVRDALVLVNDCSPDPGMSEMLAAMARTEPEVFLLTNETNQGFVRSANRGMALCRRGDVLLLNSDTRVFPGVFDELCNVAGSATDIGTVTALSNNATIFSYPHPKLRGSEIADMGWDQLAQLALDANAGKAIDVPTGHGFCLLIRREVLNRVGKLDESYGRGYGEENDFCQRAADLGYRNVAALGAFVEHREGVSFAADRESLMRQNLVKLGGVYPEYAAAVSAFERNEGMRCGRWPLDAARLHRASTAGASFALVVTNWLDGGARKAIGDIEQAAGYGEARRLTLSVTERGLIEVHGEDPLLRAVFAPDEVDALFALLSSARIAAVLVHQLLGFGQEFLSAFRNWVRGRRAIFYAHDFYPLCPRVTMIDATQEFCGVAPVKICARCVAAGGAHEAARLPLASAGEHRDSMGAILREFSAILAPSESAAGYYRTVWPDLPITVAPHPEPARPKPLPRQTVEDSERNIALLGALGPHKGSAKLLELARRARLLQPDLRFHVIGHTNIDSELRVTGNVTITGKYEPWELPRLVAEARSRIALFLHNWPETWSYTLTEAVALGLFPLVPDIGAPAERVRRSGFGSVFGFPIRPLDVLDAIESAFKQVEAAIPDRFWHPEAALLHRRLVGLEEQPAGRRQRRPAPALRAQRSPAA